METEEGHISGENVPAPGQYHDQAYEWPVDDDLQPNGQEDDYARLSPRLRPGQPVFRFVALHSTILPVGQTVAVLDAYPEVQIGRDKQLEGSSTPRIRLKEMEVSKLHATAFWDGARKEWNIVDMGSMHGTFLHPGPVSSESKGLGLRLSQARAASIPRRLRHSDQLTIGGTTFQVHIHESKQGPCQQCAISGQEEIPLFPAPRKTAIKRTRTEAGIEADVSTSFNKASTTERDPKKALHLLKRSLLTRHDVSQRPLKPDSPAQVGKYEYVDRAARRRLLHPSKHDIPGTSNSSPTVILSTDSSFVQQDRLPSSPVISKPPTPLTSTNIGHRLLLQQGWTPGNALGIPSELSAEQVRLVDPLEVKSSQNRAGLGMKQSPTSEPGISTPGLHWRDREKFKRFDSVQGQRQEGS